MNTKLFRSCVFAAGLVGASGCSGDATPSTAASTATAAAGATAAAADSVAPATTTTLAPVVTEPAIEVVQVFDPAVVHTVSFKYVAADFDKIIAEFRADGSKSWIEATVTLDGQIYPRAGLRLKGNSSLFGLGGNAVPFPVINQPPTSDQPSISDKPPTTEAKTAISGPEHPERLPWLIRLDKYVKGQKHQGYTDFVIRSNGTETSLNERLALQLLDTVGLSTQKSMSVKFNVNGGVSELRTITEYLNDDWADASFTKNALLYKAGDKGDYSYRGTDSAAYAGAWDQDGGKIGGVDDLAPLIEFLDFINNSADPDFAANLDSRVNTQALAKYLAMEELMLNFDDLDGPGNNSYLAYEPTSERMTVVAWDHNLAFTAIEDVAKGILPPGVNFPPGVFEQILKSVAKPNPLVIRAKAIPEFMAMYQQDLIDLKAELFDSGKAEAMLQKLAETLNEQASELVDAATVKADVAYIVDKFPKP